MILGLGHNGHIGFNEPSDIFQKETHCVNLTESMIMRAKKILVVVSGADKAEIVKKVFFGEITPQVQASVLQFHNDVVLVRGRTVAVSSPSLTPSIV